MQNYAQITKGSNSAESNPTNGPNIVQNIEHKSLQMLGSIKTVRMILNALACPMLQFYLNENEDYMLFKYRVELKDFLVEVAVYLKSQIETMSEFFIKYAPNFKQSEEKNRAENDDEEEDDANNSSNFKKPKLDDDAVEETASASGSSANVSMMTMAENTSDAEQHGSANSVRDSILAQIETKKKYLDRIRHSLLQLVAEVNVSMTMSSCVSSSDEDSASSSASSSSSLQSSSTSTDTSSSNASNNLVIGPVLETINNDNENENELFDKENDKK